MIRIGCDLDLFSILAASSEPLTIEILAKQTGAAPLLLGRILRNLAANGLINETRHNAYDANRMTTLWAQPSLMGACHHIFDDLGPAVQAMPDFLKSHGYQDITDPKDTPMQLGHHTALDVFAWFDTQPERLKHFQRTMTIPRPGEWLDVFPLRDFLGDNVLVDTPVFVDVGGSFGQQCIRLREKYPDLPGRVICQDLPATIEQAPRIPGIEFMSHDFFTENPIKGAMFYYLRTVLHDWPDDKCVEILRRLKEASDVGSKILIDEMVLHNTGVHWQAATLDIAMGMTLGAMERTRDQWEALVERAGLRIESVSCYSQKPSFCLVVLGWK